MYDADLQKPHTLCGVLLPLMCLWRAGPTSDKPLLLLRAKCSSGNRVCPFRTRAPMANPSYRSTFLIPKCLFDSLWVFAFGFSLGRFNSLPPLHH